MFFIGVFGVLGKEQELDDLKKFPCHSCDGYYGAKFIKAYKYFHVFFIPVYKWDIKYYGICKSCKSIYEIASEKGKMIESGESKNVEYKDLKIVKKQPNISSNKLNKKCLYCGEEISEKHIYCPQCGKKQ